MIAQKWQETVDKRWVERLNFVTVILVCVMLD